MDSTRRYIFNGSATAYGGRFVRPDDVVLSSNGGSALSQAGGRSVWSDTNIRLGKAFRVSFAFTSAEGLFDTGTIRPGESTVVALTKDTTVDTAYDIIDENDPQRRIRLTLRPRPATAD